jgi:hypothetical protein
MRPTVSRKVDQHTISRPAANRTRASIVGMIMLAIWVASLPTPATAFEGAAVHSATRLRRGVGDSLRRPPMRNPVRIRLHVGDDHLRLNDRRDYILKMPNRKKTGVLSIFGGRNVRVIGGYLSVNHPAENIYIKDGPDAVDGRIVHLEGLLIDASSGAHADGMKIAAPKAIVQIKLCRIVGLRGSKAGIHADVVQPFGGVKALRIDGLTASSHYNNLYLRRENDPMGPPIRRVSVRNTDIFGYQNPRGFDPPTTIRAISLGTQGIPPSDDSDGINCVLGGRVVFRRFFANPPPGKRLGQFVHPHDRMPGAGSLCRAKLSFGPKRVDWPRLRLANGGLVSGAVRQGPPPRGHFVPERRVGLNYQR